MTPMTLMTNYLHGLLCLHDFNPRNLDNFPWTFSMDFFNGFFSIDFEEYCFNSFNVYFINVTKLCVTDTLARDDIASKNVKKVASMSRRNV